MNSRKFLITGATGLIGSALVRHLAKLCPDARLVLPVRNLAKAQAMLGDVAGASLHECDLLTTDFEFAGAVDYIVHCAAPTSNREFTEHPIETYNAIVHPTQHLLDYAVQHQVKGFVNLSSLEVYGTVNGTGISVTEDMLGYVDLASPRSSYPIAKRAAEHLCSLYAHQHGVPVCTARLTQTTGPGVTFDDNRVINAFCRSAFLGEDIVLHTTGESARPYCHVADAVAAIMLLLDRGVNGEAYNVANESTYISARDLANFVREHLNKSIEVRMELKENTPYAPPSLLPLSTAKLQSLGWHPEHSLEDICKDVFNHYKTLKNHG